MVAIPKRSKLAAYRIVVEPMEKHLWLPVKDPNAYSLAGLFLSMLFLFIRNPAILSIVLILILISDWLDGSVARRYKVTGIKGYIIDSTIDRISEGFIFLPLVGTVIGDIFITFYLINNLLTFYAFRSGRHYILALRFFYLLVLIFKAITGH